MLGLIFFAIGFATTEILKSGGIGYSDWQFYGIFGCLVATIVISSVLIK